MNKINTFFRNKKTIILICIFVGLICIFFGTYALEPELFTRRIITKILRIDEDVYGDTILDTSELDLRPILDKNMETSIDNVIHIEFTVGGSNLNNVQNIVYDIALADLEIDCDLISPYVKWKLLKNGEFISEGSLDYKFDTIIDGRLVLTPIQQDLKEYSEDKTTYDNYDFYMWISDPCQSEDLNSCFGIEQKNDLFGKKLKGKIEVELYAATKKALIRKPSDKLNPDYCEVTEEDSNINE